MIELSTCNMKKHNTNRTFDFMWCGWKCKKQAFYFYFLALHDPNTLPLSSSLLFLSEIHGYSPDTWLIFHNLVNATREYRLRNRALNEHLEVGGGLKEEEEQRRWRRLKWRREKKKKQEDRKRRGRTDGRGYAWLKGARREEAIQDLCACKERKHHALTSHMQKSFLRNPLHLNLNSHPLLFTFP